MTGWRIGAHRQWQPTVRSAKYQARQGRTIARRICWNPCMTWSTTFIGDLMTNCLEPIQGESQGINQGHDTCGRTSTSYKWWDLHQDQCATLQVAHCRARPNSLLFKRAFEAWTIKLICFRVLHPPELFGTLGVQHTTGQSSTMYMKVSFCMDPLEQANRPLPTKLEWCSTLGIPSFWARSKFSCRHHPYLDARSTEWEKWSLYRRFRWVGCYLWAYSKVWRPELPSMKLTTNIGT